MSLLGGGTSGSLLGGTSGGSLLGSTTQSTNNGSLLGAGGGGSLLGASTSAATPVSGAAGTVVANQQPGLAPAPTPAPAAEPIAYDDYGLDDIMSSKLMQAVVAFRREPVVSRRNTLEAAISAVKHRLRDPQWLPPANTKAKTAVESRSAQSQSSVSAAMSLSNKTGIDQFVAYKLVEQSRSDSTVPDSSK